MIRRALCAVRRRQPSVMPAAGALLEENSNPKPSGTRKLKVMLLFIPGVISFGLGCWQVKRREWKANLLEYKRSRLEQEPMPLVEALRSEGGSTDPLEYRRVECQGVFDEEKSIFIGPRMKSLHGASQRGYFLITPLYPASESDEQVPVLVNRGWVPYAWREDFENGIMTPTLDERFHRDRIRTGTWWKTWWRGTPSVEISPEADSKGVARVCGVVRNGENPNMFVPLNEPERGQWFYFDVPAMVKATGMPENTPYVEAVAEESLGEDKITFPVAKELDDFVKTSLMPNDHLTYAFTWYALSAATTYMAFLRMQEKPMRKLRRRP